ncbi:MAG: ABC transporter permease [Bacteroidales bacterium]|nr:ABC transporter permease [Bacteroidales bacterium]
MKKLMIIVARECRMRLRRPAFWVLTLLVPVVLAVLYVLPVVAAQRDECTTVLVVDQTGLFDGGMQSTAKVAFKSMPSLDYAKSHADEGDMILYIPLRETTIPRDAFLLHDGGTPALAVQSVVDAQLQTLLRNAILEDVYQLEPSVYHSVESTHISLHTQEVASGRESFSNVKTVVALVVAVLMVVALLLFGVQVVRSVQEERQNRVAEVVTTAVKPVSLLVGKIAGVALTAIVQLSLWIVLTAAAIAGVQAANPALFAKAREQQELRSLATKGVEATAQYETPVALVDQTVQGLAAIRVSVVAGVFLLFFILGYLLYGALLAWIASRLDAEADALQWSLLIMSPLLMVLALCPFLVKAPAGALASWLTMVPFTAPVAVMARLPFGLPVWQVVVSLAVMLLIFVVAAVFAARSYKRRLVA